MDKLAWNVYTYIEVWVIILVALVVVVIVVVVVVVVVLIVVHKIDIVVTICNKLLIYGWCVLGRC